MDDDSQMYDENDLLARARQGDLSAFDQLITLHREKIYMQNCYMVQNPEDALDLTQDTFLRAWKSLDRFDGKVPFLAWVRRIATNVSIDLCRRRKRRPQTELELGPMRIDAASRTTPSSGEVPGSGLDRREIRRRIDVALETLSPDHRAVIILREIEELSYEEIARHLGCSQGTVMSRLFHARKKLQAQLNDLHEEF